MRVGEKSSCNAFLRLSSLLREKAQGYVRHKNKPQCDQFNVETYNCHTKPTKHGVRHRIDGGRHRVRCIGRRLLPPLARCREEEAGGPARGDEAGDRAR